jgi:hypothetical protein
LRTAVAHHQRAPHLVALSAMTPDIVVGLRLQRRHPHPTRSSPRDLVQLKKPLARFPSSPFSTTFSIGGVSTWLPLW